MAIQVANTIHQSAVNTVALNLAANEVLNVAQTAAIFAAGTGSGADAILAAGNNDMNIAGSIFSREASGIQSAAGNHTISIFATGSIYAHLAAVALGAGGNTITNSGQINSAMGVGVSIVGAGFNSVTNTGTIRSGFGSAVQLVGTDNTFFNSAGYVECSSGSISVQINGEVYNYGMIKGGNGVVFQGTGSSLLNVDTIIATNVAEVAVAGTSGVDGITNAGLLQAAGVVAVNLAGGNDTYIGREGQVVGAVQGGAGMDTLTGGAFFDRLEGGTENDQINGGGSGDYTDGGAGYDFARFDFAAVGVTARLDNPGLNTGEAAGDAMYNFEGLVGSQLGDILVGNSLATGNQIYGLGGNDTIRGLGGADILYGNAGADSIFTGAGTDTVWVQAADLIATQLDRVFDFTDGQDHLRFQGVSQASATITDSQGGTLIKFNVAGGQFSVFLDGITKAASADQIFFV